MKLSGCCPKCKGTKIIKDATVIDRDYRWGDAELQVATYDRPQAFVFKGERSSAVSAWICGTCGLVEFYTDQLWRLSDSEPDHATAPMQCFTCGGDMSAGEYRCAACGWTYNDPVG